jgi:diguanylate cyclase (GGDEF)-like protein
LIDASLENAKTIAGKLIAALSIPYPVAEGGAHVSASIGIATYPASATDLDTLLQHADRAMYAAKAKGKRCVSVSA